MSILKNNQLKTKECYEFKKKILGKKYFLKNSLSRKLKKY